MISSLPHIIITAILLSGSLLAGSVCWTGNAYAGTADKLGNNAEIYSIRITPNSVPAGTYPEITGFIRNASSLKNNDHGKAVFDVMAVIIYPNGSRTSLLWHNVSFATNQSKTYVYLNDYDTRQAGTYKVVYSVYNSGEEYRYTSVSKSFTVSATAAGTNKPPPDDRKTKTDHEGERQIIGIGGSLNTFNFSAGPTVILWPFKNLAVQGTYGFGAFTSYEARTFYRFPLAESLRPYIGAGYIHAEKTATVIGVDTKIAGSGFTAFGGVELPVVNNLYSYIDISGTDMKLKRGVTNGISQATATVKYSKVTICIGLVFYVY